jgi:hypothetical protein
MSHKVSIGVSKSVLEKIIRELKAISKNLETIDFILNGAIDSEDSLRVMRVFQPSNTDLTESSSRHCENELKAKKLQMFNAYKVLEFAKKVFASEPVLLSSINYATFVQLFETSSDIHQSNKRKIGENSNQPSTKSASDTKDIFEIYANNKANSNALKVSTGNASSNLANSGTTSLKSSSSRGGNQPSTKSASDTKDIFEIYANNKANSNALKVSTGNASSNLANSGTTSLKSSSSRGGNQPSTKSASDTKDIFEIYANNKANSNALKVSTGNASSNLGSFNSSSNRYSNQSSTKRASCNDDKENFHTSKVMIYFFYQFINYAKMF